MSPLEDRERAQASIHNMSAPPRSFVDLRPMAGTGRREMGGRERRGLGPGAATAASAPQATAPSAATARHVARVCLVGVFCGGQSHLPHGRDIAKLVDGVAHELADAVALLRGGDVAGEAFRAMRASCAELPAHALHDEFLDRVAALGPMDLPPLLLARRLDLDVPGPAGSPLPPLKALRLLAGTACGLFLRDRTPSASLFLTGLPGGGDFGNDSFDYYLPLAPGKGQAK